MRRPAAETTIELVLTAPRASRAIRGALAILAGYAGALGATASSAPPRPAAAGGAASVTKLLPPPDGQVYSGMFIRPGQTDADGAQWGDSRPFAERVRDTIATELAGRK